MELHVSFNFLVNLTQNCNVHIFVQCIVYTWKVVVDATEQVTKSKQTSIVYTQQIVSVISI